MGKKANRTISIDTELNSLLDKMEINVSNVINTFLEEWITSQQEESRQSEESLLSELEQQEKNLVREKARLQRIRTDLQSFQEMKYKEQQLKLQPTEKEFFKEAKKLLDKDSHFLKGLVKRYNNEFKQNITEEIFLEKIKQVSQSSVHDTSIKNQSGGIHNGAEV